MKEGQALSEIYGMRLVVYIAMLIFISSWISCGNPDLIDAVIYKLTNGALVTK